MGHQKIIDLLHIVPMLKWSALHSPYYYQALWDFRISLEAMCLLEFIKNFAKSILITGVTKRHRSTFGLNMEKNTCNITVEKRNCLHPDCDGLPHHYYSNRCCMCDSCHLSSTSLWLTKLSWTTWDSGIQVSLMWAFQWDGLLKPVF